jgi:hypothetical protein
MTTTRSKNVLLLTSVMVGVVTLASLSMFSQRLQFGTAEASTRSIAFLAGQNQDCTPANGLAFAKDIHPNTTITGASEGAYVNTAITCYITSFTYGNATSGTWAVLEGTSEYIMLNLEIQNPLTIHGQFCLNGSIDTKPSCTFATGTATSFSTIGLSYTLGSNTSTSLQTYDIDVASLGLSKTPNVVSFRFSLKNSAGSNIRMTFDNLTITYGC